MPSGAPTGAPPTSIPSPVAVPAGSRLLLSAERRFFNEVGEKAQLSVSLVLPDGTQSPLSADAVSYVSSRPQDISVSAQGEATSLVADGYSEITATLLGRDLQASVRISVSRFVGGSSGGGGGSGGGSTPTPTPTPTPSENLNVSLGFESLTGGEFLVHRETAFAQSNPVVARAQNGSFVVAWNSNGQDGNNFGIYAQRYSSQGDAQGSEFRVNTYTMGAQANHSVSLDADGDFVVAWQSNGQDGNFYGIYAQRYDSQGEAQGSEFRVNNYTTGTQEYPRVSLDADGDFVVAWQGRGQYGDNTGIYAQRYSSQGEEQGSEFQVNTYSQGLQEHPSVSLDTDGDFVVAWHSNSQDGSGYGIHAQRYNSQGQAQGSEFQVNTYTENNQLNPSVSLDADGDFVVAWQSYGQDQSFNIYAQRYSSQGQAQGSEFRVNTYTAGGQNSASVSLDADGDFAVVWQAYGQDGGDYGIRAQRYTSAGQVQGGELQISNPAQSVLSPSVVFTSLDDFVVVWAANRLSLDSDIYARLFDSQSQGQ